MCLEWRTHSNLLLKEHVQAMLRQCGGATAAAQLIHAVPVLAKLLDPKQDPVLRGTALALVDHLLEDPCFVNAPELANWADMMVAALLVRARTAPCFPLTLHRLISPRSKLRCPTSCGARASLPSTSASPP